MSVERHEATHAAMAIWLRRPIEYLERYPDHFLPGETMGHCRAPIEGAVEASQVAIALAGSSCPRSDRGCRHPRTRTRRSNTVTVTKTLTAKAATTTDRGEFSALASSSPSTPATTGSVS